MTVGTKVQQTLAGLESAMASLKTFALDTNNQQAKTMFQQSAQQLEQITQNLKTRWQQIQQEEPQYKS